MRKKNIQSEPLLFQLTHIVSHLSTVSHCEDPGLSSYHVPVGAGGLLFGPLQDIYSRLNKAISQLLWQPYAEPIQSINVLPCTGWPKWGTVL